MIKKFSLFQLLVAIALIGVMSFNGCAWYHANVSANTQAQIASDLSTLAHQAISIAQTTVDSVAQGKSDAEIKNNLEQSAGDFVRSLENSAATTGQAALSDLVTSGLNQWLPDKSHWGTFAADIGSLLSDYVKNHGSNPSLVNQALETVATALNTKAPAIVATSLRDVPPVNTYVDFAKLVRRLELAQQDWPNDRA
jgi:hypothetical protein